MANKRDFYEILGLTKSASTEEIKKSYRKLALEWHPDRNKSPDANDRFKEINEAYAVLSDSQKKAAYDQFGHAAFTPGGGFGGGAAAGQGPFGGSWRQGPFTYTYTTGGDSPFGGGQGGGFETIDPFEIFEQFFGGGFSGGAKGFRRAPRREVYQISIEFWDAVKGATKEIHLPKGRAGEGSVKKTIKIPAGVDTGSRIRFDEFDVVLEVKPDKEFAREGDDLVVVQHITYPQAVLGAVVEVPTIDGPLNIRVAPGTQPGTLIRLRGKGVPHTRGNGRGDQYVKISLNIPTHLSREQKELLGELQDLE